MGLYSRRVLFVNGSVIAALLIVVSFMWGGGFSLTGYAFADFYDSQVMYTLNSVSGEETTFVIPVTNEHADPITGLYAQISIEDLDSNQIVSLDSEPITILPESSSEILIPWNNDVLPGTYIARITLYSDSGDANFVKTFTIEARTISIESIQVNEFELGDTVNLDVIVQNHLPLTLEDVSLSLLIYEDSTQIIDRIEADSFVLQKESLVKLNTTWDTSSIAPGTYNAQVVVSNNEYSANEDLVFTIGINSLSVTGVGFSINYAPQSSFSMLYLILIIIAGVILINVVIWSVIRKKK